MEIAIVGLARAGKTTVFNTLTRGEAQTGGFGGLTVNVGVVKVPDARLTALTELFKPKREVPADVTYVDLPAPPLSADGVAPAEIPADQLARLRNADELLHVVRAFDDAAVPHPSGSVDPLRDVESSSSSSPWPTWRWSRSASRSCRRQAVTARRPNARRTSASWPSWRGSCRHCVKASPSATWSWTTTSPKRIRGFRFLTEKPVLVLLNVGEGDIASEQQAVDQFAAGYRHAHTQVEPP